MKRGYVCFCLFITIKSLCLNQYIMERNPRLSSYTIGMMYLDYILLLLVCGDYPLTSKRVVCWNILESTPDRIPLIKSFQKCNRMLFIIYNYKLGIRICSQPRIDLNSQSNFYDVLTRPYKYLVQHYLPNNIHSKQFTC